MKWRCEFNLFQCSQLVVWLFISLLLESSPLMTVSNHSKTIICLHPRLPQKCSSTCIWWEFLGFLISSFQLTHAFSPFSFIYSFSNCPISKCLNVCSSLGPNNAAAVCSGHPVCVQPSARSILPHLHRIHMLSFKMDNGKRSWFIWHVQRYGVIRVHLGGWNKPNARSINANKVFCNAVAGGLLMPDVVVCSVALVKVQSVH